MCKCKSDWDRLFQNKEIEDNFQNTFKNIRKFRNIIAHCKLIGKADYEQYIETLKAAINKLDDAIKITEEKDFEIKNRELNKESIVKFMSLLFNAVNSAQNLASSFTEQTCEFLQKLDSMVMLSGNIKSQNQKID